MTAPCAYRGQGRGHFGGRRLVGLSRAGPSPAERGVARHIRAGSCLLQHASALALAALQACAIR
eukprot:12890269-Alexandrium_andersonii.AAC.1